MCGIVGYVGERPARELLLDGLRQLEYRGYDSAGISVISDGQIDAVRAVGNLNALQEKLDGASSSLACSAPRLPTARTASMRPSEMTEMPAES